MGGLARIAIEMGHKVTGSDQNCYPPMSDQLSMLGVELHQGYDDAPLKENPDMVIVGNALVRGMPVVESLLNSNQAYTSGPQWLSENLLRDKWVIAVAGTHGKTTTASMIAWILEDNGYNPGFLIGGVLENFGVSARNTDSNFFVMEADEYDSAFFDKRSKFVHYHARTCILNNLEFDHADIFDDLKAIEIQFHHLVRTVPENGLIIRAADSEAMDRVIERGCWTNIQYLDTASFSCEPSDNANLMEGKGHWSASKLENDASQSEVYLDYKIQGILNWSLIGDHNLANALAAIAAVKHVGVKSNDALKSLGRFSNVKRRMELKGVVNNISVYDDFAHHPTAIKFTLKGLRHKVGKSRIIAIVDPRSNTMRMGIHKDNLLSAVQGADLTIFHLPEVYQWKLDLHNSSKIMSGSSVEEILALLSKELVSDDHVLIMSNGSFDGIHQKLLDQLKN